MNTDVGYKKWAGVALVLAILVVGFLGMRYPIPLMPEDMEGRLQMLEAHLGISDIGLQAVSPTKFRKIHVDHEATVVGVLTASGGVVGDVTGAVTGNVIGDLTGNVTGDLTNSTFLILTEQTAISVTAQAHITPTGTLQPLTSAAAVSTSLATAIMSGTVSGQLLILANENITDVITIVGTGANVECKADVPLGPGDILWLWWNEIDWECLSGYDNS